MTPAHPFAALLYPALQKALPRRLASTGRIVCIEARSSPDSAAQIKVPRRLTDDPLAGLALRVRNLKAERLALESLIEARISLDGRSMLREWRKRLAEVHIELGDAQKELKLARARARHAQRMETDEQYREKRRVNQANHATKESFRLAQLRWKQVHQEEIKSYKREWRRLKFANMSEADYQAWYERTNENRRPMTSLTSGT